MLQIRCPYCGERPELEFRCGGEAHIARPLRPVGRSSEQAWAEFLFYRGNDKGVIWPSVGTTFTVANAGSMSLRDTVTDEILVTYEMGTPRPDPLTIPTRRKHEPAQSLALRRSYRPGQAAQDAFQRSRDRRLPWRYGRIGAARQRRSSGREVVQVSPAPRDHGQRCRRTECPARRRSWTRSPRSQQPRNVVEAVRWPGRCARKTTGHRSMPTSANVNNVLSPVFSAGFYYKTFMWPPSFWTSVYEPFIRRAAGLGQSPTTSRSRSLCPPARPLRSSDHRRRTGRDRRGAGRERGRSARHAG